MPLVSLRGGVLKSRDAMSPITSVWVDLASSVQASGEVVAVGTPSFSDSQFKMGEPLTWVVESKEADDYVSLPIVLI